MGRKLNTSTPTVINTELIPLDESFYIDPSGQTEQWYYDNNNQYSPNRKLTPLTLTPHLSAVDHDTDTAYTPSFSAVRWFANEYDQQAGDYVETEITAIADGNVDYFKNGNVLVVKKNVSYTRGVTIRCEATYIDPRDSGITYNVDDTVLLSTSRDATIIYPTLDIDAPSARMYNPLTDSTVEGGVVSFNSQFTFPASAQWPNDAGGQDIAECHADNLGTEEIIPQNETAVVTCAPYLDLRYDDVPQTDQQFMYRRTGGGSLSPIAGNRVYIDGIKGATVKWNQLGTYEKMGDSYKWAQFSYSSVLTKVDNTLQVKPSDYSTPRCDANYEIPNTGHKYYYKVTCKNTSSATISIGRKENNTVIEYTNVDSGGSKNFSGILTQSNPRIIAFLSTNISSGYVEISKFSFIDLTEIGIDSFTTVEEVESWLAVNVGEQPYYPYDAGSLVPVRMTGFKTVGFNLWDEQWEPGTIVNGAPLPFPSTIRSKNFIPVMAGQTYYSRVSLYFHLYDADKNFLRAVNARNFVVEADTCYVKFRTASTYGDTYQSDIAINFSDANRNGTYEAYNEDVAGIDVTTLKGKLNGAGNSVVIFPDGMKRVGNVYDEIVVEGTTVKAIKRVGAVDMGTLTWRLNSTWNTYYTSLSNMALSKSYIPFICGKYINASNIGQNVIEEKQIGINTYGGKSYDSPQVKDSTYADADAFKTAMSGVYLYYELATPQEYIIDNDSIPRNSVFEWYGISNNTEVKADTLPWYVSGQGTDVLTVDAMYGESINVVLRAKDRTTGNLYPNKVYKTVEWRVPDVDTHVVCKNGSAVRSNTTSMEFTTIINVNGSVLDESIRDAHLRFNWKTRKSNSEQETDQGWGSSKVIAAADLRNVRGASSTLLSTLVFPYVYLLGAYEPVERDGQIVYERSIN